MNQPRAPFNRRPRLSRTLLVAALAVCLLPWLFPAQVLADCTLTATGRRPLPDLATPYQGYAGGLYPGWRNVRPAAHEAVGLDLARQQVVPRDAQGRPDAARGKIVLISIGMSNTNAEFGRFMEKANADPARNRQLVLVNGASPNMVAERWAERDGIAWQAANQRLTGQGLTPAQVQVAWVKLVNPGSGPFPAFAQELQADLEVVVRNLKYHYPNIRIAYFSSRTRAYVTRGLSPEPAAYESAYAVKWLIAKQMRGDPQLSLTVAPWLTWGPYLWADGLQPRSDGFIWRCEDTASDFVHPSLSGQNKVADQLLAFFKTDPTARPWFLKPPGGGPVITQLTATATTITPGAQVRFNVQASDPDGVAAYVWTFGDGTFGYNLSGNPVGPAARAPVKTFYLRGVYPVRVTVVDTRGNWTFRSLPVTVAAAGSSTETPGPTPAIPDETTPTPGTLYLPSIRGTVP